KAERPGIELDPLLVAALVARRGLVAIQRLVDPLETVAGLGAEIAASGPLGNELQRPLVQAVAGALRVVGERRADADGVHPHADVPGEIRRISHVDGPFGARAVG